MRLSLFDRYATQLTLPEQTSLLEIDQAAHTHAVILSQTAGTWGAETGANDQGVCAGYTSVVTRLSRSGERVLTPAELTRCVICFCCCHGDNQLVATQAFVLNVKLLLN